MCKTESDKNVMRKRKIILYHKIVCCNLSVTVIFPINIKVPQVKCQHSDYTFKATELLGGGGDSLPLYLKVTSNDYKGNKRNTFNYHCHCFTFYHK